MSDKIKKAIDSLKDFQRVTVDYVFDRMYARGQKRMLIADEVGLGKTIIAKGIIARAYEQFLDSPKIKKQFKVVYICSNQALSGQNIKKLNFLDEDRFLEKSINRLTYLSFKSNYANEYDFKISALTPGTSFDNKSSYGEAPERAILFALLANYKVFFDRWDGLSVLLKGSKGERWNSMVLEYYENRNDYLRKAVFIEFKDALQNNFIAQTEKKLFKHFQGKQVSIWQALQVICNMIENEDRRAANLCSATVSLLRRVLAKVCVRYLDADIFILDEFQRYNQLIKWENENQPPAVEMAKAVFSIPNARILLLSATPFKAYTNDFDELNGEVHYSEFKSVLKFLIQEKSAEFWNDYEKNRKEFHRLIQDSEQWKENNQRIKDSKKELEDLYLNAMVRTERLLVSKDGNAMVEDILKDQHLSISKEDIQDFVNIDSLSKKLNELSNTKLPIPIEYVKSTPYALSFLEGYQLKKRLSEETKINRDMRRLVNKTGDLFINKSDIENYKPIISQKASKLPNAKLRKVLEKDEDGWKFLWVPPTLPYYDFQGVFKNSKHFSKTLIFSSWVMVPKMIASILSYEAERKTIGTLLLNNKAEDGEKVSYFDKPRSPKQQFTFRTSKLDEAQRLSNYTLLYPCITLAELYSPKSNLKDRLSLKNLKKELSKKIRNLLDSYNIRQYGTDTGDMDKWFWAAPVLLDRLNPASNQIISSWFEKAKRENVSIDSEGSEKDSAEHDGKLIHFQSVKNFFQGSDISLPALDDLKYKRLIDHLVEVTLAAPGVTVYRSLSDYFEDKPKVANTAYCIALSFLSLFNKSESIAIVRLSVDKKTYWQQVLEYCTDGNIQSMLDEFIYLIYDCENQKELEKIQAYITDILTLKTSTTEIDNKDSFLNDKKKLSIRTHYALDFGLQKKSVTHGTNREVNLRQTFNSPFRPFVLASTSIGQEGLDFHLYCKKIVHWNLPSNPIDFEQREGRINRYKGLVIRQNVADNYKDTIAQNDKTTNLWDQLFEMAKESRKNSRHPCDLIPFWHIDSGDKSSSKIERYVPLYPFSKDIEKYKNIQHVLTYYRLTFGQPRQDDLIRTFKKNLNENDFKDLMINLCPLLFKS